MQHIGICNNCGKTGHNFHQCKLPIISNGIIAFRLTPDGVREYLMVRRKETLGFIDFLRGKYVVSNLPYIANMVKQMTTEEKDMLRTWEFDDLWRHTWKQEPRKIASEEAASCEKFYILRNNGNLNKLLDNNDNPMWLEPEWGFPKGRREHGETDLECALREFCEETGLEACKPVENIMPYEEIFMGSNYKSYKHKYFLMKMDYKENQDTQTANNEIGAMCWMPFLTAMNAIRPYNLERRKILISVNTVLTKYLLV